MAFLESSLVEIDCDAPPYPIVRACRTLGFHSPEDVRWCQTKNCPSRTAERQRELSFRLFHWLFGSSTPKRVACFCGQPQPPLESYTFILHGGDEIILLLRQCPRCSTIFWQKP